MTTGLQESRGTGQGAPEGVRPILTYAPFVACSDPVGRKRIAANGAGSDL